tara:strand:+ start:1334 stop:1597 length:264 start_codon:yes stop_codon:yes gene_type:complete
MYKIEKLKSNEVITLKKKYYGKRFLDFHPISASLALFCYYKNSFIKTEPQYQYVGIYENSCINPLVVLFTSQHRAYSHTKVEKLFFG